MAYKSFKLPDIGEGTAEAELVAWHVNIGDQVEEDQPLCDVMTDKATVEVTAPFGGKVVERTGAPGEMLPVGGVILQFEVTEEGDGENDALSLPALATVETASVGSQNIALETAKARVLASPAVRKRADQLGVDLLQVTGTGPQGRVRQCDLESFLKKDGTQDIPSSPPSRQVALAPLAEKVRPQSFVPEDDVDEVPVIGLRRRIAERMQDTKRRIPHFSYIEEVDVTQLEALRAMLNATRGEGLPKLTLLPLLIRALTKVLPEFPQLNALYDDSAGIVRRHARVHAGIATQTPQGLVVTVLRDAAKRDLWNVAGELTRLSTLARSGRASPSDLSGSTITITSLGAMGGLATTPVINSPEVAIIGVNKLVERPVVREGRIEVAKVMNLSSSFDHRVVDGWDAASFIQRVKALLETPALLFIDN
ncbi:dihydrolipoamide acetyltransferase family protein [Sphingobium sp.]|uniref:dihydrolipoamide acetyltransferase family protein n=1 Tax=Sphingobium sp. TaxID=1912891 RepID=UPI0028BE347E|nr:dihydrolipoamide acetyltransferase family protein [Sphingobium sp.]